MSCFPLVVIECVGRGGEFGSGCGEGDGVLGGRV